MRTLNKLFATGAMVFLLMLMAPHKSMAQDDGYVSDQEFYDELQQYGTWVQDDQYGDVWVPDVDGDFRPYATGGYWVQTDYGTTWVSDYPWGWATFHYGRWRYDDYYGWEWIPGHEWAPAWVSWRQGGGYYGWAPMGPGLSVTLSLGGFGIHINDNYWVYAPQRYITSRYINRYYAPRTRVSIIIRKTTYIHNTYVYNKHTYITGPRPADIQRITRQRVTVYKINNASRPGAFHVDRNAINIYRPAIRKSPDARPVRVVSGSAYRNEHPTEGIGKKGAVGYNHGNAGKLASIARSDNPNSTVVKVNPKKDKPNEPNKANEPANNPAIPAGGHKTNEPKANPTQPAETKGGKDQHKNEPVTQPVLGGGQQAQPAGNKPAEPQGNAPAKGGKGHHKNAPVTQPEQGGQQQPAANKPAEQQTNPPAQTEPAAKPEKHQHKQAPAVIPPAQNNNDQAKKDEQQQQQARDLALQQKQQAAELKRQQNEQAKQAAQQQKQQAQQARQQQQQDQQAARQQAQQQKAQQQQAQQARQQQQQEQQAARQQAQQQKVQQQAQQAAKQQAQQQKQQEQQARQQAQQQKKQQEEQQKQQQQTPPRN